MPMAQTEIDRITRARARPAVGGDSAAAAVQRAALNASAAVCGQRIAAVQIGGNDHALNVNPPHSPVFTDDADR